PSSPATGHAITFVFKGPPSSLPPTTFDGALFGSVIGADQVSPSSREYASFTSVWLVPTFSSHTTYTLPTASIAVVGKFAPVLLPTPARLATSLSTQRSPLGSLVFAVGGPNATGK